MKKYPVLDAKEELTFDSLNDQSRYEILQAVREGIP